MNKYFFIFLFTFLYTITANSEVINSNINKGFADISYYDITRNNIIELSGTWQVIPDTLVSPEDISNHQSYLITIPSYWNENFEVNNYGVATIFCTLKIDTTLMNYGIDIQQVHSAFSLYVNGAKVGGSGVPSSDLTKYFPKESYTPIYFTAKDSVTIILHIANFSSNSGGFAFPPKLMNFEYYNANIRLNNLKEISISTYLILISILFIVYSYFFKNSQFALYSGIITLLILIQNLFMGNQLFSFLFPTISEINENRIQFTSLVLLNYIFILYLNSFYKAKINIMFIKSLAAVTITFIVTFWLIENKYLDFTFELFSIVYFSVITYTIYFLIKMIQQKENDSLKLLIAFSIVFVTGAVDLVQFIFKLPIANVFVLGLIFFSFAQILILLFKHSEDEKIKSIRKSILKQQNIELLNSRKEVDVKVKERTHKLKEALDKVKAADIAKTEFISTMSHELRTPMNGIIGMTELLLMDNPSFTQKEYLGIIKDSSYTLLKLINEILDLSKIEEGNIEISNNSKNIYLIVTDIVESFKPKCDEKNIKLELNYDHILNHNYYIDSHRISQVMKNIIDNAVKFTLQGSIIVTVEREFRHNDFDRVKFSFKDTGIGIPQDKHEIIFDKFTQVDSSISRNYNGSGLGLNISKKVIEALGGTIQVKSIINKGSLFTFSLDLKRDEKRSFS